MSNDYSSTKPNPQAQYPEGGTKLSGEGVAGFSRVEDWLTPERLKSEFLFGISLAAPATGQVMSDSLLQSLIRKSAARLEIKCKIAVTPQQKFDRIEFDRTKYLQGWNQLQVKYGNISSVEEVAIRAVNSQNYSHGVLNVDNSLPNQKEGSALYIVPLDWIDMSLANKGILHFVPLQTTFSSYGVVGPSAGSSAPLFAIFSQLQWIPSFWAVKYTIGFQENSVPAPVNELIGLYTSMEVISMLGPLNRINSQSISLDGSSQSTSGPGNQLYALRYTQMQERAKELEDLIKHRFGKGAMFMSHI
jgi:hypothetical protein